MEKYSHIFFRIPRIFGTVYNFHFFFSEDLTATFSHGSIQKIESLDLLLHFLVQGRGNWIEARVASVPHGKAGWPQWAKGRTAEVRRNHPVSSCWVVREYLPDCHKTL